MSAFRAVLASHAQLTSNRMRREMGRRGLVVTIVVAVLLVTTVAVPLVATVALLGYAAGGAIEHPFAQSGLGVLLLAITVGGGILSGTTGGARQLAWESYRAYPLEHRTLFAAELVASVVDIVPLMLATMLLAALGGVAWAQPHVAVISIVAVIGVMCVLLLVTTQMIVASFAAVILRRLRVAIGFAFLAVALAPGLFVHPAGSTERREVGTEKIMAIQHAFERAGAWLPTTSAARSIARAAASDLGGALASMLYPAALLVLAMFVASRLVAREVESGGVTPVGGDTKRWTFRSPAMGVARLTWHTMLDSAIGRFGLVIPLITLVLVRWPLARFVGGGFSTPGAFAYVALSTSAIQLNQFGLDGHGIKSLMLLPLSTDDVFRGKTLGIAFYVGVQVVSLTLLLVLVQHAPASEAVGGLLAAATFFFLQNMVGRWTSSWMPRRLPRRDMRSSSGPGPLALIALGLTIVAAALVGGTWIACARLAPALLVPAMAVLAAGAFAAHRATLASAVRAFDARRERVVEAIG